MAPARPRTRRRAPFGAALVAALAGLVGAGLIASAQPPGASSDPFGLQPRRPPATPQGQPPAAPPAAATSPVIARVGGRPITQQTFDRLAQPYFAQLRAQMGEAYTKEVERLAGYNVIDELVRREVLAIEAQRQKIEATQADIDALLMQDPFFLTDGRPDPAKLASFKSTPGTNYLEVLPRLRELGAVARLEESLRRRFTPTSAQLRAEWSRRSDQVRFKMLPLLARDMPLEPESSEAEWAAYFAAHPDEFTRRTRIRLRYLRIPLPAEGDSTRPAAEAGALARGREIADSLRAGTLADSAAGFLDTGAFDIPSPVIPGLGRVPGLTDSLARADEDSTYRVVGPHLGRSAVIVGRIAERRAKHVPPMREVLGEVKRRADGDRRRRDAEAAQVAFYRERADRWRGPRVSLTRIVLDPATIAVKPPAPAEVDRWYALHGRMLFGLSDSSRAWMPPLDDSLRAAARERMMDDERPRRAAETLGRILPALRTTRDARGLARAHGAAAETLSLSRHGAADSLFRPPLLDSLLASVPAGRGAVAGPRVLGDRWVVWRIDAVDTSYVPPYETVRVRSDQEYADRQRADEEAEARARFEQRRGDYLTPVRYGLDVVAVAVPPPDSVRITEAELRRRYEANRRTYRVEEQVHARHILFMTRDGGPDVERVAAARAESLLAAIRAEGGDFAELARRFSQEPGAPTSGGDLGWFGRGAMVKEFETAAFALEPGGISPVVKTQFGYHIIRVEERRAAGIKPFEEVRDEIRGQLALARGDSTARRVATALRRRLAAGGDERALTAPHGGIVNVPPVAAGEPLPGVGPVPELQEALPAWTPGRWAPGVHRANDRYVVVRLRERVPQRPAEFEEVKVQAIEDLKNARRRATLERKVEAIRAGLAAGASLDSLAAPFGGLRDSGLLGQAAPFVPVLGNEPRVIRHAFTLAPGEVTDTLQVAQGVAWVRLEEKRTGDDAAFRAAAPQLEAELTKERYDAWLEARKRTIPIAILRADLRRPRGTAAGL